VARVQDLGQLLGGFPLFNGKIKTIYTNSLSSTNLLIILWQEFQGHNLHQHMRGSARLLLLLVQDARCGAGVPEVIHQGLALGSKFTKQVQPLVHGQIEDVGITSAKFV
jgi:hypothetical protein